MTERKKDTEIQIKINKQIKEEFYQKCKAQAINPSAWLRKKIYEFLEKE